MDTVWTGAEARIRAAFQEQLLHPDVVGAAMAETVAERRRQSRDAVPRRQKLEADLANILVDDKKPDFVSEVGLMSTLGAGTRSQRWHKARSPIKLAA